MADNPVDAQIKSVKQLKELLSDIKKADPTFNTRSLETTIKNMQESLKGLGKTADETGDFISAGLDKVDPILKRIYTSMIFTGKGALEMGQQFQFAFAGTDVQSIVNQFDNLTAMTRSLRTSAIDVGSAFGQGFDQVRSAYQNYASSVVFAQESTYQSRQEIEQYTKALAQMGIGLDDLGQYFSVAGAKQNILSEGFLLGVDSGLGAEKTFGLMATAARQMGLDIENAGQPIVALENIARSTGLPISQLADRIFNTAKEFSRLGLTVDGVSPIIQHFVNTLGPGFKGLAIDETTRLVGELAGKINTTQAAFIAMQGGLAKPGTSAVGAQLAFEDAFKNPMEIIKSLQQSISSVTGGKIIKFEEARANPQLENQFKIQRDLLAQLTGNTDPQSQRTLLAILSDLQSGKSLTVSQNKTLDDALKSGTQKQEEQRTLADRIGKLQVGLLTQIALNTSAGIDRFASPQAQSGVAKFALEKGEGFEKTAIDKVGEWATAIGEKLAASPTTSGILETAASAYTGAVSWAEKQAAQLRQPANFNTPNLYSTFLPEEARPKPAFTATPPTPTTGGKDTEKTVQAPGQNEAGQNITLTFRSSDGLMNELIKGVSVAYNNAMRGH